jgi:hypothetical protein
MATENTPEISPELIVSTPGGYHAWWTAANDDDFRKAVAERGTPRAKALYAILQDSDRKTSPREYRRCSSHHAEG